MENEIWIAIKGYEGYYEVSTLGRVKSYYNNKESILKPLINSNNGYYFISLYKNNIRKTSYLHRLVGTSFLPNPENKPEINHLNGDKSNNQVTNLQWVTPKQNIQHAWQTGLMENTRKARKTPIYSSKLDIKFESCTEAAIYLQTHYFEDIKLEFLQTYICLLLKNKITKSKYDFCWEYVITNQ